MIDLSLLLIKFDEKLNSFQEELKETNWRSLNSKGFALVLENAVEDLTELKKDLKQFHQKLSLEAGKKAPNAEELVLDASRILQVMKKNLKMEKQKKTLTPFEKITIQEERDVPELYAAIQEELSSFVFKARSFSERVSLFMAREKRTPLEQKSIGKNLIDVLEKKENELLELKQKYNQMRKKSFMGFIPEQQAVDLEERVRLTELDFERQRQKLEDAFVYYNKDYDKLKNSYAKLKMMAAKNEQLYENHVKASNELTNFLKKERDYAKKILLDSENDLMKLRADYTSKLIGLEEAKLKAKEEAREKLGKENKELEQKLKEANKSLNYFKELSAKKEKEISLLENKLKKK